MPSAALPGWGCAACLGYNQPGSARCATCGVLDPEQAKAIEAREKAAREEERRRIEELDRQARQALAGLKIGGKVELRSVLAAHDGFAELERRVRADEQAAAERASRQAQMLIICSLAQSATVHRRSLSVIFFSLHMLVFYFSTCGLTLSKDGFLSKCLIEI